MGSSGITPVIYPTYPNGSPATTVPRPMWADARDYGTLDPSGATDNQPIIQAAATAVLLNGGGGTVALPPTNGGAILLAECFCPAPYSGGVWGSGAGQTIKLAGVGTRATVLRAGQVFTYSGLISGAPADAFPIVAQLCVEDVTLDGNYEGGGGTIPQPATESGSLVSLPAPDQTESAPGAAVRLHHFTRVRFWRPPGFTFQPAIAHLEDCEFDFCGQPDVAPGGLHWDNLGGGNWVTCEVHNCRWYDSSGNYADFTQGSADQPSHLIFDGNESYNHQIGGLYALGTGSRITNNGLHNSYPGSYVGYDPGCDPSNRADNRVTGNDFSNIDVYYGTSGHSGQYGDVIEGNTSPDSPPGPQTAPSLPLNMLTAEDAGFVAGLGNWTDHANCTLTDSTAESLSTGHSMLMTAVAAGAMTAIDGNSTGFPVVAGRTYTLMASAMAAATPRAFNVQISWWTAAFGSFLGSTNSANINDTTTGFTQAALSAVAPAGAVLAEIYIEVVGAALGEGHYATCFALYPGGSVIPWSLPGAGTITNPFPFACQVAISGGTVTVIDLGGMPTGLTSGAFVVPAAGTIGLTASVAPAWTWSGL